MIPKLRLYNLILAILLLLVACGQKVEKTDDDDSLTGTPVYSDISTWQVALEKRETDLSPNKVLVLPDNSVVIGGESKTLKGKQQILLIKLDPDGTVIWYREFSKSMNVWIKSMATTDDGGILLLVQGSDANTGSKNALIMKVNSEGKYQWDREINKGAQTQIADIDKTNDANFVILGAEANISSDGPNLFLSKVDQSGKKIWSKTFPQISIFGQPTLTVDDDGGFLIGCPIINKTIIANTDILLLKTDSLGTILWQHNYGGAAPEVIYSVQPAQDKNYWLTGSTKSMGAGQDDAYLIRTDDEGEVEVEKAYGDQFPDVLFDAIGLADGGLIATGYWRVYPLGMFQVFLLRVDNEGEIIWEKKLAIGDRHQGRSISACPDGGFIIACTAKKVRSSQWQTYLVKFDRNGNIDQGEPNLQYLN